MPAPAESTAELIVAPRDALEECIHCGETRQRALFYQSDCREFAWDNAVLSFMPGPSRGAHVFPSELETEVRHG